MATSSNTLGGLLDLEREMAGIAVMTGQVLVVESAGVYGLVRAKDKVKVQTGQTQQQIGTTMLSVTKLLKAHTG